MTELLLAMINMLKMRLRTGNDLYHCQNS